MVNTNNTQEVANMLMFKNHYYAAGHTDDGYPYVGTMGHGSDAGSLRGWDGDMESNQQAWGAITNRSARLAEAILCDVAFDNKLDAADLLEKHQQAFHEQVIANLNWEDGFAITDLFVLAWVRQND